MQCLWWWVVARLKSLQHKLFVTSSTFLVLSSARSGSTLLMQYLGSHPSLLCSFQEPLNRETLAEQNLVGYKTGILNYLTASVLPWRPWAWRYAGCKVFCEQLEYCRICLHDILVALRHPVVVVLYRRNMLDTYVSLHIAFQTGVWFSEEEVKEERRVHVDWQAFQDYVQEERERWRESLQGLKKAKKIHFLSYEELSSNRDSSLAGVFSFLGVSQSHVTAFSKKQNPLSLEEKVLNIAEIQCHIKTETYYLTEEWMQECINLRWGSL